MILDRTKLFLLTAAIITVGCANQAPVVETPRQPASENLNDGKLHYGIAHTTPKSDTVLLAPSYRHVVGDGRRIAYLTDYNATVIAPTRPPTPTVVIDMREPGVAPSHDQRQGESDFVKPAIIKVPAFEGDAPFAPSPETPMHPQRTPEDQTTLPGVETKSEFDLAENRIDNINGGRLSKLPGIDMNDARDRVWTLICEGRANELSESDRALVQETQMPSALEPFCEPTSAIGPTK